MYILGISQGHDAAAALVKNGKVVAAAEEERFNRVKHSVGYGTPVLAAKFCMDYANITPADIDIVAVDQESPDKFYAMQLAKMIPSYLFNRRLWSVVSRHLYHTFQWHVRQNAFHLKTLGFPAGKFRFIRHHDAHAASAFFCSGFKQADVLVIDGVGETDATSLYRGDGGLTPVKRVAAPNSLGLFYGGVTVYLGYEFAEGEGKVMGLAPYGEMTPYYKDMERFCQLTPDGYQIDQNLARADVFPVDLSLLEQAWGAGPPNPYNLHEQKKYRDIAFALQQRLEDVALHLLKTWKIGDTLCLAGGVALNCKMNGVLLEKGGIKDIFIQPAAGDSGGCIGAALMAAHQLGQKLPPMEDAYLGPSYSREQIVPLLEKNKLLFEEHNDIEKVAAGLLADNKIVGWFQGRMEMGPRALGNRSILMSPAREENKDKINLEVKFREPFRPFCPSMLASAAEEYLVNPYPSPYMILSFDVQKNKRKEIPAVVHVDGSCRPQTVEKTVNPRYWKLIKAFENESGVPVLLNTSLNIKGEPMVCSPKEALNCFFLTGMDYMVLGDFLVRKK